MAPLFIVDLFLPIKKKKKREKEKNPVKVDMYIRLKTFQGKLEF